MVLTWTASTDNVGVTGYDVLRNGSVIGSATSPTFTDTTVTTNQTYSYTVRAKDAAGNPSPASTALPVTTPAFVGKTYEDTFDSGNFTSRALDHGERDDRRRRRRSARSSPASPRRPGRRTSRGR